MSKTLFHFNVDIVKTLKSQLEALLVNRGQRVETHSKNSLVHVKNMT